MGRGIIWGGDVSRGLRVRPNELEAGFRHRKGKKKSGTCVGERDGEVERGLEGMRRWIAERTRGSRRLRGRKRGVSSEPRETKRISDVKESFGEGAEVHGRAE